MAAHVVLRCGFSCTRGIMSQSRKGKGRVSTAPIGERNDGFPVHQTRGKTNVARRAGHYPI